MSYTEDSLAEQLAIVLFAAIGCRRCLRINQNRYNPFGMIRMLTFGTVVAFYGMGIELLKKIGIEITFMIFREQIKKYELEKAGADEILLDWL